MIFKMQQGGTWVPPLVSYQPVTVTGGGRATAATASASSGETSDLTDKDLMKMMEKLEGLPSDMALLTDFLQNFYIDQQFGLGGIGSTSNIASRYLQALAQMRTANFNRKEYDNAFEIVKANGGINELAVDERGYLFCMNSEKDFKLIKPEELKDNTGYQPLTNSELLQLRAYNPDLAFNSSILNVVKNGIGIESVNKMINDIVSKIGTTTTKNSGFFTTNTGEVVSGLKDLTAAIASASQQGIKFDGTVNDLYSYELLTMDQKKNAEDALRYIYRMLPANAKALLKTKTSTGTDEDAYQLIGTLISSQLDSTQNFDIQLRAGKTAQKAGKAAAGTKDETELNASLPLNVMQAIGGYDQRMILDRGDGIQMQVNGTYYQQVKTPNGDPIIDTSLKDMLAKSGLQSIIKNTNNITYGDQKVSMDQLGNITYNNTGLLRVNLPVNNDGTVNLNILADYQQAESEIEALGQNITPEQISQILQSHGLDELLDANGRLNKNKVAPFLITEGYTTEKNGIKDSDFVKHIKNPTEAQYNLIKKTLTVGTGKEKEVPEIDEFNWFNPFDWFGVENIYKATIYIPLTNNQAAAAYGANQKLDYDEQMTLEQKYKNFEKQSRLASTSADVLL